MGAAEEVVARIPADSKRAATPTERSWYSCSKLVWYLQPGLCAGILISLNFSANADKPAPVACRSRSCAHSPMCSNAIKQEYVQNRWRIRN